VRRRRAGTSASPYHARKADSALSLALILVLSLAPAVPIAGWAVTVIVTRRGDGGGDGWCGGGGSGGGCGVVNGWGDGTPGPSVPFLFFRLFLLEGLPSGAYTRSHFRST
jgi:hypothetical protein